ncbi:unnamed protein product [Spirodela intermedia]|uniref:ribose-5-phosphate isomerase n=1 Tax=Spirodela intermedia TaxID=51605 RepID=A0A7I8IKC2_SPIIN|nr:unnamed protein product [Spirodela intermedia]CAA6657954.1 unnamed protein product [Spirodela intermedia]
MASTSAAASCCVHSLRSASLRRSFPVFGGRVVLPAGRGRVRVGVGTGAMACAADGISKLLEAAKHTVDNYIKNGMMVGLGSGPASCMAIHYLGGLMKEGALTDIVGIPTSISSASEAAKAGIPLDHFRDSLQIDFAFDDADVVEEGTLAAVIGRRKLEGGESIMEEKSIIRSAGQLAFIVDEDQYKQGNWLETAEEIDDLFLGDAETGHRIRRSIGGDFPLVTKEGHHVLDVIFTSPIRDLTQVAAELDRIDGVVDHGVVSGLPCTTVIASEDGLRVVDNFPVNAASP